MSIFLPARRPAARSVCIQCQIRLLRQSRPSQRRVAESTYMLENITASATGDTHEQSPRWARTPQKMKAPVAVTRTTPVFVVNEDPQRLDDMYNALFGKDGDKLLSEEVKWLVVTHKSFDNGKRGYNERLAQMGKCIVNLQTSLALMNKPATADALQPNDEDLPDQYGRKPIRHEALKGVENIQLHERERLLDWRRLSAIATRYGIRNVMRWNPRNQDDLVGSGLDGVLSDALYAAIGALALEKGAAVANQAARRRVLHPLGVI